MKYLLNFSLIFIFSILLVSYAKEKKATHSSESPAIYSIDPKNSTVQWTAFKTSAKVPVKGIFNEIKINKSNEGSSPSAALEGLEFEIPVSSIFSKNPIRDAKLNKFFFAVMENSLHLKGSFKIENQEKGKLSLTMNGLTKDLPFDFEMSQDTIIISASMDLNNWQAQAALESINQACLELHRGADGVSKTWDEVLINAKILAVKK